MSDDRSSIWEGESTDPSPDSGAWRFQEWAGDRLPSGGVRETYGRRLVLAVSHRLDRLYPEITAIGATLEAAAAAGRRARLEEHRDRLFEIARKRGFPVPPEVATESPPELTCPDCQCGTKAARADCLIRRFRDAFESITPESIADWCSMLTEQDARNVLAFIREEENSDPLIREAHEEIIRRQDGYPKPEPFAAPPVSVSGDQGHPAERLRDAFTFTAMVAVREWLEFPLVSSSDDRASCVALVACGFGMKENTLSLVFYSVEIKQYRKQ